MSPEARPHSADLVQMAALTDALVRAGPRPAAVLATERLAGALLAFSRRNRSTGSADRAAPAREALRLRAEAQVLGRRLRLGPVRLAPVFAWRVSQLLDQQQTTSPTG